MSSSDNKLTISVLARDSVKAIVPYASARSSMSGGAVWLNANENALAPEYQLSGSYNRYPECQPPALIAAYAAYAGFEAEPALAIWASSFDFTPLTPTAPRHAPSFRMGTPPSSMPSTVGADRNE